MIDQACKLPRRHAHRSTKSRTERAFGTKTRLPRHKRDASTECQKLHRMMSPQSHTPFREGQSGFGRKPSCESPRTDLRVGGPLLDRSGVGRAGNQLICDLPKPRRRRQRHIENQSRNGFDEVDGKRLGSSTNRVGQVVSGEVIEYLFEQRRGGQGHHTIQPGHIGCHQPRARQFCAATRRHLVGNIRTGSTD